jgi:hypothetical protein
VSCQCQACRAEWQGLKADDQRWESPFARFVTSYETRSIGVPAVRSSTADLFADAKVRGGHAHRSRGTILLGHSSVRITEKHYNPWNRARLVLERMAGTTGLGTSPHSDSAMKTRKLLILQRGTDGKKPLKEVVPPKRGTKKVQGADRDRRNERGGMATAPELRGITQGEALSHA